MKKYLVKTKYTYEKRRQTDYTHAPEKWTLSQNLVAGRFLYEPAEPIGTYALTAGAVTEVALTDEQGARFASVSGFMIFAAAAGALCRATLWGDAGQSFCSVCALCEAAQLFSTVKMGFVPVRMTLEATADATVTLTYGYVLNTLGEVGGQAHFYTTDSDRSDSSPTLTDEGGALRWGIHGKTYLNSPAFPDSSDTVYNMKMPRRNTVMVVLTNCSSAKRLTLSFATTTHPWGNNGSVSVELAEDGEPHAYYFNLSALPAYCDGRLAQFTLCADGEGDILIHRYTFEQEKPVRAPLCEILSCTADPVSETIMVRGRMLTDTPYLCDETGVLKLYTTTMADEMDSPAGKRLVGSCPLPTPGEAFVIDGIPLRDEYTTRLPYQFALFAEHAACETHSAMSRWVCDRFYIENYEDFEKNPHAFDLPEYTVSVEGFGAKGDGFTNDTDDIQAALDHVELHGGGTVVLPGSQACYGRRYVVTNLLMPSNTALHIEEGAVLWQSQRKDDYPYEVAYGHDGVIPGINWTHNLHVSNLPLIQAENAHHVRISGKGSIRMMDTGSEEGVGMPGYATGCPDRIHCIPIGFFLVEDCECRDFEIIRSNNYHTEFNHCNRVAIQNVRLHEVKCVSGDGFGMAGGKNVFVNRCFFQSNDDGIVMSTHMHDPRGILWWTNMVGEDNGCRNIKTVHSYLNSGGGKALAFITWGTSDPDQSLEEIDGVEAYDNYLTSVNPVGAWHDNPYNGKVPFDNTETDDYSPVKNVRIFRNRYEGNCTLGPIQGTNILTDCGVHSTAQFRNGDFTLGGMANWTLFPNQNPDSVHTVIYADKEKGCIECFEDGPVAAAQGLRLLPGTHTVSMELWCQGAEIFVADILTGEDIAATEVQMLLAPTTLTLTFTLDGVEARDVWIGVRRNASVTLGGYAVFDRCTLHSVVDEEGIAARRRAAYLAELEKDFIPTEAMTAFSQNGKMMLSIPSADELTLLPLRGGREAFSVEAAVRVEHYNASRRANGFGYRFSIRDDGESYRELFFNESKKTLTLTDVTPAGRTVLYLRDHFFFTSNDFHIFRIEVGAREAAVWIDGAQYAVIPCPAVAGEVALLVSDANVSVAGLKRTK